MEVIVVLKHYYNYEDSYTEIIGVRETDAEADALIEDAKKKLTHPLMSPDKWYGGWRSYRLEIERLKREERNSPKKGGWLKKYNRENLKKEVKVLYDKLSEICVSMSFDEFYNNSKLFYENKRLVEAFFLAPSVGLTEEQISELSSFYDNEKNPDNLSFEKKKFDTKA